MISEQSSEKDLSNWVYSIPFFVSAWVLGLTLLLQLSGKTIFPSENEIFWFWSIISIAFICCFIEAIGTVKGNKKLFWGRFGISTLLASILIVLIIYVPVVLVIAFIVFLVLSFVNKGVSQN